MEDHNLAAKTIWLLCLCFSCKFVMAFKGFDEPQWPNHGGGIQNRREAFYERKINPKVVSKLAKKWQFVTGHNVTATPSVSSDGVVYFPSSNGFLYAVYAKTGDAIWQKNLTKLTQSPTTVFSRTTPVITKDLLLVAIYGPALVLALDRNTGDIVWSTLLDSHILALLTMSGTVYESSFFVGTSSLEEDLGLTDPNCCNFQGSFVKIDLRTGVIKWRTIVLPNNHGNKKLYSGAGIWGSSPPIDVQRNLVYFATGNLYTAPSDIEQCEANRLKQKNPVVPDPCIKPDDHSESILALDLDNGTIIWSHHLGAYDTWNIYCALVKQPSPNCPPIPGPDADFGEAPLLHTILDDNVHPGSTQDVVIAGQKNGIVWALDRDDGQIVWATVAGPGGFAGGASWGLATDGQRVYTNIVNSNRLNFTLLPSHEVTIGGGWVALDANNGSILWSTAAPNSSIAYGPVTVANGVVFVTAYGVPYGALLALEATSGEVLWQYNASSSLAGGVSVVNGCVYLGEGSTAIGELSAPISVGGSHADAFCVQFHH
ncbi:unnamed protein product [Sphagnum troendelagicum]